MILSVKGGIRSSKRLLATRPHFRQNTSVNNGGRALARTAPGKHQLWQVVRLAQDTASLTRHPVNLNCIHPVAINFPLLCSSKDVSKDSESSAVLSRCYHANIPTRPELSCPQTTHEE